MPTAALTLTPRVVGDDGDVSRDVRASDAERELTAERLRRAMSQGRLSIVEYDERVAAAYAATTRGQLADLTDDLPGNLW